MKKFLCLIGFFTVSSAQAAITVSSQTWVTNSKTMNIDCMGGNFLLVSYADQLGNFVTAATYNGATMTKSTQTVNSLGPISAGQWYITNPASGNHQISLTTTSAGVDIGAVCFSGVNTATPVDTQSCALSHTVTWNTNVANDVLTDDFVNNNTNALTPGAGQTRQWYSGPGGGTGAQTTAGSTKGPQAAGSQTMSWTDTSDSQPCICATAIEPSGGATTGSQSRLKRMEMDE